MDMKRKSLFEIFAILLMAASYSCDPNPVPVHFGQDGTGTKSVELRVGTDFPAPSKSSLGAGIESLFTGAVLAVYDHETGILEAEIEIPADMLGNSMLISLPMGGTYDMYLIGNLRLLADDGSAVLPSMPATSAGLETFDYRLDGGAAGDGFRRERFDEVSRWGIPLCWSRSGVDPLVDTSVDISMQRLFAKVVLKIDHSGFAGTDREAFVNGSVHIRQANCRLQPFAAGGSRAAGSGDVIVQSDYEDSMENGLVKEFVFYVPENMQGVLMPGNTSAGDKDMEGVEAASGIEGIGARLTFLEFVGRLNMADSGFEGDVTYRFFLGRDDCTDFTVERNKELRISLKFNPLSIFEPDWKLDSGGLTDSRRIFLSGDLAGTLPQDKEIYVIFWIALNAMNMVLVWTSCKTNKTGENRAETVEERIDRLASERGLSSREREIAFLLLSLPTRFPIRRNPIPPVIISRVIVTSTTGSSFHETRLVEKRSKPALLNADTEWKTERYIALGMG